MSLKADEAMEKKYYSVTKLTFMPLDHSCLAIIHRCVDQPL